MMFKKKPRTLKDEENEGFSLDWASSQRWNPQYTVPRNSIADEAHAYSDPFLSQLPNDTSSTLRLEHHQTGSMSYGSNRRDLDTHGGIGKGGLANDNEDVNREEDEFSHMAHWLETLAELYMNELDNRARWDPRWLNITRRERFEGLTSAAVTVIDYLSGDTVQRGGHIASKKQLADTLQQRPENCAVRVIMVSDLSRFVMGALGHLYSVEPEFWFEHLINSGYGASDSGLKLKNAVWMNWAERKTRFRQRALPGVGQRTEWNLPRRNKARCWAHLRWGRLGLLHYLGRKGFHEDEIDKRLGDGRWFMERDVSLDRHGLLMTKKRQARLDKTKQKRKKNVPLAEMTSVRSKTTNVYRAYSTFESIPKNPTYWVNRDLRVMAPEGASYWSGVDGDGKKTIILLFDPTRSMKNQRKKDVTPSLTFMPRAMEIEKYTDEELWRIPDPGETYLDPPQPPMSEAKLKKQQQREATKQKLKSKKENLERRLKTEDGIHESKVDDDSTSSDTSDSEYDSEYEKKIRDQYRDPPPYARHRDFARKYSLTTHELVCRYMDDITTTDILQDNSIIPSILTRLSLDDSWQLLAEIRLELDHLDGDFGASLHNQLLESMGTTIRQNLLWMRSALQELRDWASHLIALSTSLSHTPDLMAELKALIEDLQNLQGRIEQTLNLLISITGLAQSSLVIDQTDGINKLTELAFLFVPLSFITSVFSMQVLEFTVNPPSLWSWGLVLSVVVLITYLVRITLRSPSLRIFVLHCHATILNRFSSSRSGSAARRLNTVSSRAIAKFLVFFSSICVFTLSFICLMLGVLFLLFGGLWLGTAATAIYFIITRWPEPSVLIPCFISLLISGAAMWASWSWSDEIVSWITPITLWSLGWIKMVFPATWLLDSVEDDDLAKEGVNTYARQALILAT